VSLSQRPAGVVLGCDIPPLDSHGNGLLTRQESAEGPKRRDLDSVRGPNARLGGNGVMTRGHRSDASQTSFVGLHTKRMCSRRSRLVYIQAMTPPASACETLPTLPRPE